MLTIETNADFSLEKEYCFHVLFREMLGTDYRVVWTTEKHYRIRVPNGASVLIEDHFWGNISDGNYLKVNHLPLSSRNLACEDQDFTVLYGWPVVQEIPQEIGPIWQCGADLFASTFFMLTRWEEYVLSDRDAHGRFPASASAAVRFGFMDRPVVNEWADLLFLLLHKAGWQHTRPERGYRLSISCDVDHPRLWWSAADRLKTLGGSLFSRGNPAEFVYWLRNYTFGAHDPYDVFDEWMEIFREHHLQVHFNFLGDRKRSSDCYYPVRHPFVRKTMENLAAQGHFIGFHPSYEAYENAGIFERELESVRQVSPVSVQTGRQHYLRFAAPFTWRAWGSAGMDWDSTLGYSELEGFRCGICHDYPVFDFLERKMLRLREKPLIAMDVTLAQYQKFTPEEALDRLLQLKAQVVRHGGEFVFLWHNSSWNTYFWVRWKSVFLQFIST